MKLDKIYAGITTLLCLLIAYAFYSCATMSTKIMHTIGSFIFLMITGLGVFAAKFTEPKTTINIKTISIVFFIIGIILNMVSCIIKFSQPTYIITCGLFITIYILIAYSIERQKQ